MDSTSLWLIGCGIAFVLGVIGLVYWLEKKRSEALAGVALRLGMSFLEEDESLQTESFNQLPLFQQGHSRRFRNVVRGDRIVAFGYRYTIGTGKSQTTFDQTVAAFRVENGSMPTFRVTPEGLFDKIGVAFGGQDIDFKEDPEFSKRYRLRGSDESALRQLFHVGLRQQLLTDPAWCLEGAADSVVLYRRSKRVSPDDLTSFIQKARRLFEIVSARALAPTDRQGTMDPGYDLAR